MIAAFFFLLSPFVMGAEIVFELCDSSTEYLDTSSLSCTACADNSDGTGNNLHKVPDTDVTDSLGNPLRCKCADGYKKVTQSCSDAVGDRGPSIRSIT